MLGSMSMCEVHAFGSHRWLKHEKKLSFEVDLFLLARIFLFEVSDMMNKTP